jgi:myo-inositol catabolism protein IolC
MSFETKGETEMPLGYHGKLYILAFDHRGSFQKKWFGLGDDITEEDVARIADAKSLIYEGLELALQQGAEPSVSGALVDEQFGGDVPQRAKARGIKLAMPVEKSGQNEFDFEYGDDFGAHIEKFDPDFSKVLVRYNPDDPDAEMNKRQLQTLKRLADWLHERDRKFLFELLVPATEAQLEQVGGDNDRYDAELRPELMRRAIAEIQDAGVEVDIWKIEGVDERSDCEALAEQTRAGGRDDVVCVLLGRGASDEKVDHWLRQAAPVEGFIGFAIGRSIWGDPLTGFINGSLSREAASQQVCDNYLRFVNVYEGAEATQPAGA